MTTQAPIVKFSGQTQPALPDLDTALTAAGAAAMMYGGVSGGTTNAQTITVPNAISAMVDGYVFRFVAGFSNTAAVTLTVTPSGASALPPLPLCDQDGSALGNGAIIAGRLYEFVVATNASVTTLRWPPLSVGGAVGSVFGRTGAVVAVSGDYAIGQITGAGSMAIQAASAVAITGGTIAGLTSLSVVGSNVIANSVATATAGAATLPPNPLGFIDITLNGFAHAKIPYYSP